MSRGRAAAALAWAGAGVCAVTTALASPYTVDPTHTTLHADVSGPGPSTQRVRLDRPTATFEFDRAARRGVLRLAAPLSALEAAVAPGSAQAAAPSAPPAPGPVAELRFESAAWRFEGDRVAAIDGELILAGRRMPVTWRAVRFACYTSPLYRREVCGGDFETEVDAGAFGPPAAGVRLLLQIEALAPAPT